MAWGEEAAVGLFQNWELPEMASVELLFLLPEHCPWGSSPPSVSCSFLECEYDSESDLDSNVADHPNHDCGSSQLHMSPGISALQVDECRSCPLRPAMVAGKCDNGWLNVCVVVCTPDIATEHCLSLWLL